MAFTDKQIQDGYVSALQSGQANPSILQDAFRSGIDPNQLIGAVQSFNPSLYSGDNYNTMADYVKSQYAGFAPPPPPAPAPAPASAGAPSLTAYTQNPYLPQMADDITRRVNLSRDMGFNAIRGDAVGVGGLGGTRQSVAEGLGTAQAADNLSGQLAGLFGGDYNNQMNRNLQQYQGDQSYNLGLGGLSNQKYGMDQNFYTAQRGQDQQGALIGANLYGAGTTGQFNPLTNASGIYNQYTGFGTTNGTTSAGGGVNGVLGGAIAGGQLAKNLGFSFVPTTANSPGGVNSSGFGTGSGFGNQDFGQFF